MSLSANKCNPSAFIVLDTWSPAVLVPWRWRRYVLSQSTSRCRSLTLNFLPKTRPRLPLSLMTTAVSSAKFLGCQWTARPNCRTCNALLCPTTHKFVQCDNCGPTSLTKIWASLGINSGGMGVAERVGVEDGIVSLG